MRLQEALERLKRFRESFVRSEQVETDPMLLLASLRERCVKITDKLPNRFDWTHINSMDVISHQPVSRELEEKIHRNIDVLKQAIKEEVKTDDETVVSVIKELRPAFRLNDIDKSQSQIGLHLTNPTLKVGIITFLPLVHQGIANFNLQVFFDPGTEDQRKFRRGGPMASLRQEEAIIINHCLSKFLEGKEPKEH